MADKVYTVLLSGHEVEIQAPENASPEQLRAAAEKAVLAPSEAKAPLRVPGPPQVPFPSEFGPRPVDISPADPQARSATAAFREGFFKPRRNDPFGLNYENRSPLAPLNMPYDIARGLLELGESTYGGLKQGTGQLLYNLGVSKSSPSVIAQRAFELPEVVMQMPFAGGLSSGLTVPNQVRLATRTVPSARVLSPEQQRKLNLYKLSQQYGVDLLPADIGGPGVGGGTLRGVTAGVGQTVLGGPQVRAASTRAGEQMGEAVSRTARMQGQPLTALEAGELMKKGAESYVDVTSKRASRLYDKAKDAAGDLRIPTENAVNAVDEAILAAMEGGKAANDPAVLALQGVRDRLTRFDEMGGMSFNGVRQVISDLGAEAFGSEMVSNNLSRVLKNVRAAAREDLNTAVRRTGNRSAIKRLDDANRFWENRIETINDVLEPIVGAGKSGEDVVAAVQQMSQGKRGGARRLSGLLSALPPKAADNARATLIQTLGQAKAGAQGAEGGVFSPSTFLTNWNNMSPEGRNALIGSNPVVRRHLENLAKLAEARKATESLANTSATGRAINVADYLSRGAQSAALLGGAIYDFGTALTFAALDAGAGKLLASPEFTRIVAGAPKGRQALASSAARARVVKQLGALAVRQPGFQPYINQIAEKISSPTPPQIDYEKVGEPAPDAPDYSALSDVELGALRESFIPQEDVLLKSSVPSGQPTEPVMNATAPVE